MKIPQVRWGKVGVPFDSRDDKQQTCIFKSLGKYNVVKRFLLIVITYESISCIYTCYKKGISWTNLISYNHFRKLPTEFSVN